MTPRGENIKSRIVPHGTSWRSRLQNGYSVIKKRSGGEKLRIRSGLMLKWPTPSGTDKESRGKWYLRTAGPGARKGRHERQQDSRRVSQESRADSAFSLNLNPKKNRA